MEHLSDINFNNTKFIQKSMRRKNSTPKFFTLILALYLSLLGGLIIKKKYSNLKKEQQVNRTEQTTKLY